MGKMSEQALKQQADDSKKAKTKAKADFAAPDPAPSACQEVLADAGKNPQGGRPSQAESLVPERESTETLIVITLRPGKVATVLARDGVVVEAGEAVEEMKGWNGKRFAAYCKEKGWTWEVVSRTTAK